MGCYDNVTFERSHENYGVAPGAVFQTKTLYAAGAEFSITYDGKLVEHLYRYEGDPEYVHSITRFPLRRRVLAGERTIDYHGDVLLYGPESAGTPFELVARFTHGRLEWLRTLAEYPAPNRALLVEQGAR